MKYRYWLDGEWSNETELGNSITSGGEVQADSIPGLKQRMKEIVCRGLRNLGGTTWEGLVTVTKIEETILVDAKPYKISIQTIDNVETELEA